MASKKATIVSQTSTTSQETTVSQTSVMQQETSHEQLVRIKSFLALISAEKGSYMADIWQACQEEFPNDIVKAYHASWVACGANK